MMAAALSERTGKTYTRKDFEVRYYGLNHFGWWTDIHTKDGKDVMPILKDYIKENGFATNAKDFQHKDASWKETYQKATGISHILIICFPGRKRLVASATMDAGFE